LSAQGRSHVIDPGASSDDAFGLLPAQAPIVLGRCHPSKLRVLVCAPCNTAVDEIALRLLRGGLLHERTCRATPAIVRAAVTACMHPGLVSVSLDAVVRTDHRCCEGGSTRATRAKECAWTPPA
jgi:AAA domain